MGDPFPRIYLDVLAHDNSVKKPSMEHTTIETTFMGFHSSYLKASFVLSIFVNKYFSRKIRLICNPFLPYLLSIVFAVHFRLLGNNGGGIVGMVDFGLFVGGGVIKAVV